ncbi:TPA: hypothetical protein NJ263_004627 [Vibrio parahaemolyticus]|nr:hypothetical protein [Vibrio sp. 1579]MBE4021605.1 hypothetical protein [Vibrio parahaemolyticus]MDW2064751.1 hypothetical protein [Vibrio sp. 1579]HCE2598529.1 hypothetical protein [Vibrio parahaemolyticus]HCG6384236.1 hypothetical protein [Vibrio parahaemolyticus]HCG6407367.1 hypothetical protein [Vibrio parahaemolyticus]
MTKSIMAQSNSFVLEQAEMISSYIDEKAGGVSKIAQQYKNQPMTGSADELINQTKSLANALNLESAARFLYRKNAGRYRIRGFDLIVFERHGQNDYLECGGCDHE